MKKLLIGAAAAALLLLGVTVCAFAADPVPDQDGFVGTTDAEAVSYRDVQAGDWFYNAVQYVGAHNLMGGTAYGFFSPGAVTTRGMVATTLWRMSGEQPQRLEDVADVQASAWYGPGVIWALESGILTGYDALRIGPNEPVTRQELAAMFYRYAAWQHKEPQGSWMTWMPFKDNDKIGAWSTEAVAYCNMNKIMTGKPGNMFAPADKLTRAELAKALAAFDTVLENTAAHAAETPGGGVAAVNPMVRYATAGEQYAALGFLPVQLSDSNRYQVSDFYVIDGELGETDYKKAKAADPEKTAICLRQQQGSADISGYHGVSYKQRDLYGVTINEGLFADTQNGLGEAQIAWFSHGGFSYSLSAQGIDSTEFDVILKDIVGQVAGLAAQ